MKTLYSTLTKRIPLLFAAGVALLLSACGTYNNNQYGETDGIYAASDAENTDNATQETEDKSNYYKQYFKSNAEAYTLPEDGDIFTDVDAYSTTERLDEDGYVITEEANYERDNGGWGSNAETVEVNIYNNYGWGYSNPYWYGNYWGYNYRPYWGISLSLIHI